LRDITATMLRFAGVDVPSNMDSQTLPGLPVSDPVSDVGPRTRIFGLLTDGWMINDGRWKLARYSTGESVLFDLDSDPLEQDNLIANPEHAAELRRLDAELTIYVMDEFRISMHDRLAHSGDMSQDPAFGRQGWQQPFPAPIHFAD